MDRFHAILGPTVPLSRHIFAAPTRFYKTGVVFMAWLNGHQSHFTMVGGQQSTRSLLHLAELFRLADARQPAAAPEARASARMKTLLALHGIEQSDLPCATSPATTAGSPSTPRRCARARGVDLPLPEIIEACARRGIRAISPWRDQVAAAGLDTISQAGEDHGLELSGYCRGGMFPPADAQGLAAARDDNRRAVDEACELQRACLVLVVGGLPGALAGKAAHKDIALARSQVRDGIAELLDYARAVRMPLAIEPLHPMYAADRACINTLEQALDVCDELDPQPPVPAGAPAAPRWA